jgi:AcrR family transcriptional regulator
MKKFAVKQIPTNIKNESLVNKRRQQIFEAAMKLFPKKGYHSTTLREISKETGITLGNLYDYISTKEDILYIIQERATQAVIETVSTNQEGNLDSFAKLRRLINSELDMVDKYQDLILIIYRESYAWSKKMLHTLLKNERHHVEQFEEVIAEGIKKGVFKETNARMLANMVIMLVSTWVLRRWDLGARIKIEEMRRCILETVFNGIVKNDL